MPPNVVHQRLVPVAVKMAPPGVAAVAMIVAEARGEEGGLATARVAARMLAMMVELHVVQVQLVDQGQQGVATTSNRSRTTTRRHGYSSGASADAG